MIIPIILLCLLLGFVLDDLLTYLLFLKGWGVLESNPVFHAFGITGMMIISIGMIALLYFTFAMIWKKFLYVHKHKIKGYKLYDVWVFLLCFIISFIVINKVILGVGYLHLIVGYTLDPEVQKQIDLVVEETQIQKETNPEQYTADMKEYYDNEIVTGISYWRMLAITMFSFILFRVGTRVSPNDDL